MASIKYKGKDYRSKDICRISHYYYIYIYTTDDRDNNVFSTTYGLFLGDFIAENYSLSSITFEYSFEIERNHLIADYYSLSYESRINYLLKLFHLYF